MKVLGAGDQSEIGRYRLLAELGRGGMGRVLLGVTEDERLVAVKVVHPHLVEEATFRARFRREVRASRRVSGPCTAAVVDADPEATPLPWLASVFVPGPSLRDVVEELGSLSADATLRLASGLAEALSDIHAANLIHRDLKPSNVLLAADRPRVIDFGIVRATDAESTTELTHTGWLIGSPAFMSPEQAEGERLTPASDVFSLGSVLAYACTGVSPFVGTSTPRTLYEVVHSDPDLDSVPARLREVIRQCLAKDPADRPSPRELVEAIDPLAASERPWPAPVHTMLDSQHAEVLALLGRSEADTELIERDAQTVVHTLVSSDTADSSGTEGERETGRTADRRPSRRTLLWGAVGVGAAAAVATPVAVALTDDRGGGGSEDAGGPLRVTKPQAEYRDAGSHSVVFSPDGKFIAAGHDMDEEKPVVRVTEVATGRTVATLSHKHKGDTFMRFRSLSFSPDGRTLAGGGEARVVLWDVSSRSVVRTFNYGDAGAGNSDCVVAYSRKGGTLATAGPHPDSDNVYSRTQIHARDADTGRTIDTMTPFAWEEPPRGTVWLDLTTDGKFLATVSDGDDQVFCWGAETEQTVFKTGLPGSGSPHSLSLHPDGSDSLHLALVLPRHHYVYDHRKNEWETSQPKGSYVLRSAFSPGGETMVLLDNAEDPSQRLWLWDWRRRRKIAVFQESPAEPTGSVRSLTFSPDGSTIALGTTNSAYESDWNGVRLWKVPTSVRR